MAIRTPRRRTRASSRPRRGGSWPGYVFTGEPLQLPAGHFGLGHGMRAHAPDEYFLIDSQNEKVAGRDAAVRSYVDYLYALTVSAHCERSCSFTKAAMRSAAFSTARQASCGSLSALK